MTGRSETRKKAKTPQYQAGIYTFPPGRLADKERHRIGLATLEPELPTQIETEPVVIGCVCHVGSLLDDKV